MRLPLVLVIPVLIINALIDWYLCRLCDRAKRPVLYNILRWSSILLAFFFTVIIALPKKSGTDSGLSFLMWSLFAYFSIYIPKYIFCIFSLLASLPKLFKRKSAGWLRRVGSVIAVVCFGLMWWGTVNRYHTDVRQVDMFDSRVPQSFDGFKIVQLSDIHTGTYGTDTAFLSRLVNEVNELNPDVVLFTGDIVNRHSTELEPFIGVLNRLKAKYGVYSVLGNHDYGDYYSWPSEVEKMADRRHLASLQQNMGWKMLNNSYEVLRNGSDSIVIIGVENIGDPPFHVYGDLDTAYPDVADPAFKILMSHNPAHWVADIKDAPDKNIALTLSGHTHAMQMELLGVSPAALRYPTWGGMYADNDSTHHLYVNIGIGEVGLPARIGATPEITLITLHSNNK